MTGAHVDLNDLAQVEAALRRYLAGQVGASVELRNFRRCSVGFSWLTISFDLWPAVKEGEAFILQIGPPSGLFAPYSARPQVLALGSLEGNRVPVPHTFWHGDEHSEFGAPFFVSERLPGDVLLPWSIRRSPSADAQELMGQFIDVLARIHATKWEHAPIAEIADGLTADTAAVRQIDDWSARIATWSPRSFPMLTWAEHWLRAHAPVAPRVSIIHGDYRIGNFLQDKGRITGILDWEMAHLGDPHEDIAWACLPMFNGGSRDLFGMLPRSDVFARYTAANGIPVCPESVRFYEVFALYKSVAINLGAVRCCEDGRYHDVRMAAMGTQVAPTLKQLYRTVEAPL
jgi:aminoglycoside phosphotransferase (APT) family kinase protein